MDLFRGESMEDRERKERRYRRLLEQAEDLLRDVPSATARMATVAALLHHKMPGYTWTGFYLLEDGDLIVGPYQGLAACVRLERPRGVCWASVLGNRPVVVPDVHRFPGHIACDARSRSEVVVPLRRPDGEVVGVLDVDSTRLAWFDETDAAGLQPLADLVFAAPPRR